MPAPPRTPSPTKMALRVAAGFALLIVMPIALASPAEAQLAQISQLKDVAFGTIATTASSVSRSQNVCVEVSFSLVNRYSITAIGNGPGGALTLANGAARLAYDVLWNAASGQTSGTALIANQATGDFAAGSCFFGSTTSASLITILRADALSTATAGSYTGTLTLVVTPQ